MCTAYGDIISMKMRAYSRESALQGISEALHKAGIVDDTHCAAVQTREEEYPTGLPTTPIGVAIPHADPKHVLRPGIAVVKLDPPIFFCRMDNPSEKISVSLVFMLALEGEHQVDVLKAIMALVTDPSSLRAMDRCQTPKEMVSYLREYFHDYEQKRASTASS